MLRGVGVRLPHFHWLITMQKQNRHRFCAYALEKRLDGPPPGGRRAGRPSRGSVFAFCAHSSTTPSLRPRQPDANRSSQTNIRENSDNEYTLSVSWMARLACQPPQGHSLSHHLVHPGFYEVDSIYLRKTACWCYKRLGRTRSRRGTAFSRFPTTTTKRIYATPCSFWFPADFALATTQFSRFHATMTQARKDSSCIQRSRT
ncbi:hypothetical protein QBC39DRAFT_179673 [Podospora conica]|nr:hypothetical protein QBC39DRAFT_179673 [Schizothecium conicum]